MGLNAVGGPEGGGCQLTTLLVAGSFLGNLSNTPRLVEMMSDRGNLGGKTPEENNVC